MPWLVCTALVVGIGADRVASDPASGQAFQRGPASHSQPRSPDEKNVWMLASFNIHSAVGLDGVESLDRIAGVVTNLEASGNARSQCPTTFDFIGLNEVRANHWIWSGVPQVESLAGQIAGDWLFAPAERQWGHDHFGNGAVSRAPVAFWQKIPLPCTKGKGYRNLLIVDVARDSSTPLRVLVAHIDRGADRVEQLKLVFRQLLTTTPPVVLLGDLNTSRDDPRLQELLAQADVVDLVGAPTEPEIPRRIDWILGRGVTRKDGGVVTNSASDHPLVWTVLETSVSTTATMTAVK